MNTTKILRDIELAAAANDTTRLRTLLAQLGDNTLLSPTLRRRLREVSTSSDPRSFAREIVDDASREFGDAKGRTVVALGAGGLVGLGLGYLLGRRRKA